MMIKIIKIRKRKMRKPVERGERVEIRDNTNTNTNNNNNNNNNSLINQISKTDSIIIIILIERIMKWKKAIAMPV